MNKDIYIVIWEDRHVDTDAIPFSSMYKAVTYATEIVTNNTKDIAYQDTYITPDMRNEDIIYAATYNTEGDGVFVVKRTVDEEAK